MAKANYLVFPHPTVGGMVNLLLELEIRVALAMLSNRTLVSANRFPVGPQPDDLDYQRVRQADMLDLFDIPVKHIGVSKLRKLGFEREVELPWKGDCATLACFAFPGADAFDERTLRQFKHHRQQVWEFPADKSADVWTASSIARTFSHYSYFFLAQDKIRSRIRKTVSKITPKSEFISLAKTISSELGSYNAIHVRLGDFKDWWIDNPTTDDILDTIRPILDPAEQLVICTDNSADREYFDGILKAYPRAVFIDEIILNDYASEFEDLPFSDATVVALLTQLIAVEANEFFGTLFSTFTGMIHRKRLLQRNIDAMRFIFNPFGNDQVPMSEGVFQPVREGMFSWNSFEYPIPLEARAFSWFRDWPEAAR